MADGVADCSEPGGVTPRNNCTVPELRLHPPFRFVASRQHHSAPVAGIGVDTKTGVDMFDAGVGFAIRAKLRTSRLNVLPNLGPAV